MSWAKCKQRSSSRASYSVARRSDRAGGYLRGLTRKAEAGEFSLGPILMSQINSRLQEKRAGLMRWGARVHARLGHM